MESIFAGHDKENITFICHKKNGYPRKEERSAYHDPKKVHLII